MVHSPAVAQEATDLTGRQPGVGAQPRLHRLQSVVLGGLYRLRPANGAGQLRRRAVDHGDQPRSPVEQIRCGQRVEVLGEEPVERGFQLLHHTSQTFDQTFGF